MMARLLPLLTFLMALVLPGVALAQDTAGNTQHNTAPAVLIADDVYITGDNTLVAEGNVEALYQGQRITARSITYDQTRDILVLDGPITLDDGAYTVVLADSGQLDAEMRNGILRGARIVMDDQLQMAAQQMNRVEGRYNQLYKTAVTSCQVCTDGRPPLWQIRARRVVHDQETRQLYLDDAQFRILDMPVFYVPRLRLPDPTLERATGFLIPSLYNSTLLGVGFKAPYFIRIGDDKDLTVTPYLSTETRTLELRYRQAFANGGIEFNGAISNDDLGRGRSDTRGYIFGRGLFELRNDFILRFDIEAVNDDAYLVDYDYSTKDRLDSEISVSRVDRDESMRAALTYYENLLLNQSNSTLPTVTADATYERRFFPAATGGELRFSAEVASGYRTSGLTTDGPDVDLFADGRDVMRLTTEGAWLRNWTLMGGLRAGVQAGLAVDHFEVEGAGGTSLSSKTDITPAAAITFRYPLAKTTARGVSHVIEPALQLAWAGGDTPNVPNERATRTEFDEGNLLSLSRFAADDRRERGISAAYGLTWSRFDPDGLSSTLSFGQIVRDRTQREATGGMTFSSTSGLRGEFSDILVAGQISAQNGVAFAARGLFDNELSTTKAEARASWQNDLTNLGASYIWLREDLMEERPSNVSEWAFDGSYRLARHWTGNAQWRYDVVNDESVTAGIGLTYTNECVDIALSASRRFASSTILTPSTDISLTVGLRGFSTRTEDKSYVRDCK
ncbi:LPS assembly protein LptD [Roseovarius sp. LXJ103]|nr:LPS assembly protein LptD [Roseovarius carneus]